MQLGRAAIYRTLDDYPKAIALIQEALQMAPGATWAYRMLFGTYYLAGDTEKAIAAARQWIAANPGLTADLVRDMLPKWVHDPDYVGVLLRFDEILAAHTDQ